MRMKGRKLPLALIFMLGLVLTGSLCYRAGRVEGASGGGVPGSAGDPLITQSYLEERLKQVSGGTATGFVRVTLLRGEGIVLDSGSELMLYSGSAAVTGADGLVNLTTGELFKRGNSTVRYNLYLAPANGCGIEADGNVTAYIRGNYRKN